MGDIYSAKIGNTGNDTVRPVLVIQNNIANKYSKTVTVIPITTVINKAKLPTHVYVNLLNRDSVILAENVTTISKSRLDEYITTLDTKKIVEVKKALDIQFGSDKIFLEDY
ncbi:type II toxin-antitoxin system PemK/MazF family toxin [Brevibacillus sp. B_LB10_24]|uniref:type II toxin-antitoxin system PemK/MazF family toxin n=1 Tax=Brevibacillus sp. B_LB10_24 TaxID=3380645 RepID=UPI0038BAFC55